MNISMFAPSSSSARSAARLRVWPMIFSVFALLLPNGLIIRGGATWIEWVLVGLGVVAFVSLLAVAVVSWQKNRPFLWAVLLLEGLGAAFSPIIYSGTIFFGLAAHMLPWAVGGNILRTAIFGTPLVALLISGYWLVPEHGMRWINTATYYAVAMAGQVWIVRMSLNLRRLAEVAERERIANELHGVLGEALSKITLKAQRARQLLEESGDTKLARAEVAATERICRHALADVRQTIRAYREGARDEQGRIDVSR
jgi:two-component system, NarL family, sensor histidine kinase DesK